MFSHTELVLTKQLYENVKEQFYRTAHFIIIVFLFFGVFSFFPQKVSAETYAVAVSGDDTNTGTLTEPFKTFARADQVLLPGDTLIITAGSYTEPLRIRASGMPTQPILIQGEGVSRTVLNGQSENAPVVDIQGDNIIVTNLEVQNSGGICVNITGHSVVASRLHVHDCQRHGIYTDVDRTVIDRNVVYNTVLENASRSTSGGWSSAIKVRVGGSNTYISRNEVYHNYGEGIAVTRGLGAYVADNTVYDNYSVNVYVDNSQDIVVERNNVFCNQNTGFERDGHPPIGIALGEEAYDGWGAQLARVTIQNNIVSFCKNGVSALAPDVSGGGLDTIKVVHNTFWGSTASAVSLRSDVTKTKDSDFSNNIVQQEQGNFGSAASTGVRTDYNFWVGGSPDSTSNLTGVHDKSGDVLLVQDPRPGDIHTFQLSAASPAIDAGEKSELSQVDVTGTSRDTFQNVEVDIGAVEFSR